MKYILMLTPAFCVLCALIAACNGVESWGNFIAIAGIAIMVIFLNSLFEQFE